MIVCVCKNISDKQVAEMRNQGLSDRQIRKVLGIGGCCGKCVARVSLEDEFERLLGKKTASSDFKEGA